MAPGESDEVPVRRRIPLVRIIGITLTLAVIIGSAAGLAAMMSIRDHQAALTSCNQAIKQSDTIRTDWGKVLEQAEPYLRLGDGDVQDPKTLELVAAITRYRLPEPPAACDPDMTTNQLDHRRTSMEKTNGQIQARTKDLRDAVGKAKASRERKQLADAGETEPGHRTGRHALQGFRGQDRRRPATHRSRSRTRPRPTHGAREQ